MQFHPDFPSLFMAKQVTLRSVKKHMQAIQRSFGDFARRVSGFATLSENDKEVLLKTNVKLFLHCILGQAFVSGSLLEQMRWLLLNLEYNCEGLADETIALKEFDEMLILFEDPSKVNEYQDVANFLKREPTTMHSISLLASAFLFHTDIDNIDLEDPLGVRTNFEKVLEVSDWANQIFGTPDRDRIQTIIQICSKLAGIFNENIDFNRMVRHYPLLLDNFADEQEYLERQLDNCDRSFQDVSMGEEAVKELVMYTFGEPLGRNVVRKCSRIWRARYRRLLMNHEEYNALNDIEQTKIWKDNSFLALGMTTVFLRGCKTGNAQMEETLGRDDMDTFRKIVEPFEIQTPNFVLKRISIRGLNEAAQAFHQEDLKRFDDIVQKLHGQYRGKRIYKIWILALLFTQPDSGENLPPSVAHLADKYFAWLRHNLALQGDNDLIDIIPETLHDLKQLASIQKALALSVAV